MAVTAKDRRTLSNADLDRLAHLAEAGFDPSRLRPRRGRPFLDADAAEQSPRMTVRVPARLRDRVRARAVSEGRTVSEVLRSLLEEYARAADTGQARRGSR
jgi:hypothetical protein